MSVYSTATSHYFGSSTSGERVSGGGFLKLTGEGKQHLDRVMDEKDEKILELLQEDGRMSNVDLARAVEMTPSAMLERVRKLEERGLIKGYMALIDPHALELGLLAFIFVRVADEYALEQSERTADGLAALPSVLEVHHLAGEDCFLVKVRARDTDDLYRILKEEFEQFKNIRSTRTTIVLKTVKETPRLAIKR
ncbi:MAG TPA: Lrp/AsnC family transcriptional regulator [Pyrinomonadaceae bacterium]|nr:Lrp/AsnC family transcriptional regulator [Pyrinomonadaceae bacterium]